MHGHKNESTMQRNISYGEMVELQNKFEEEEARLGIVFTDEEIREEAMFDFIGQYIDGIDCPEIHVA